jgi:hypothetical protein
MLKQSYSRMKKISSILLAILFLISLTTVAASTQSISFTNYGIDDIGNHSNNDYRAYYPNSNNNSYLAPAPNGHHHSHRHGVSLPNY